MVQKLFGKEVTSALKIVFSVKDHLLKSNCLEDFKIFPKINFSIKTKLIIYKQYL